MYRYYTNTGPKTGTYLRGGGHDMSTMMTTTIDIHKLFSLI
jgi:hypothetical protein